MKKHRRNTITGQWAARQIEMLESPAYRVLSLSAHRVLSRIEVELAHHGGNDNGKLPITFNDFVEYGVRRSSVGPSLIELETLGFIKITQKGKKAKAAEYRQPNQFLLTTRPELDGVGPTHCKWRRFRTVEEAEEAVETALLKSQKPKTASTETGLAASTETGPITANRQYRNGTTMVGTETGPLSISRGEWEGLKGRASLEDVPALTVVIGGRQ